MGIWQIILISIILLLMYAPIIVVLIDIYTGKFRQNKWIWFVIVLLFNYLGVVFYLLIGRSQRIN
jgi:hypothetical protein